MGIGAFNLNPEGVMGEWDSGSDHEESIYATMPENEVNELLGKLGINPRPTIDAVKQLVKQKLRESRPKEE